MKIPTYIKKNWATLPKSTINDKELVMVREVENWDHGYGHHSYNGFGVDQDGKVYEVYSSGCSCDGEASCTESAEALTEDLNDIHFDSLRVDFSNY